MIRCQTRLDLGFAGDVDRQGAAEVALSDPGLETGGGEPFRGAVKTAIQGVRAIRQPPETGEVADEDEAGPLGVDLEIRSDEFWHIAECAIDLDPVLSELAPELV